MMSNVHDPAKFRIIHIVNNIQQPKLLLLKRCKIPYSLDQIANFKVE